MSASVWKEEVDTGLIAEILNSIKYRNEQGILSPLNNSQVLIRKPEEDFKPESYPCVSIYNKSEDFSKKRYNPKPVKKSVTGHIAIMEDPAIPFDLDYQLDFWSKYQEDMNDMTKTWLSSHFRQFNLPVVDDGGNKRTCNCLKYGNIVKSDLMSGGERLFHSIISYRIWVEIDAENSYNANVATKVNIDVSQF